MFDYSDQVLHFCPVCHGTAWRLDWVMFDDYKIGAYSYEMECVECKTKAKAPTEPDRPDFERN